MNVSPLLVSARAALCAGSLALLAACGVTGNGIAPVSAVIQPAGGVEGAASTKAYTCLNTSLTLILDFSNGDRGDFSSRARWTSSDPTVARVSNGDIAVPEAAGSFYSRGVVVAVRPSPTPVTITAEYLTFRKSIEVMVAAPTSLRIKPDDSNQLLGQAHLAPKSAMDLSLLADLDGVESSLDTYAIWSFLTPNTEVATISPLTGLVTALAAGAPLTAHARIAGCDLAADATVSVSPIVPPLDLQPEFPEFSDRRLVLTTTEVLKTIGTLQDGARQDLTSLASYSSSDAAKVNFPTVLLPSLAYALAASETPVTVSASFDGVSSNTLNITPTAATLSSLRIDPAPGADILRGKTLQLKAIGSFTGGISQDISRHVAWSSSDPAQVGVFSSSGTFYSAQAGLTAAASNATLDGQVTITASYSNGATPTPTATTLLTVKSP